MDTVWWRRADHWLSTTPCFDYWCGLLFPLGGTMQLIVPKGQGHNMWTGFFQCAELVAFVKARAK
jgi:hypothetical protein